MQTVEAEVKVAVHAQRVRDAGIRIERKPLNGPLRAHRTKLGS